MGRHAGFIAAAATVASQDVNFCLIPESPFYLDGANGLLAKKLGVTGKYSPSVTPTIKYKGLPKGKHTISVQLANNDHSPAGGAAQVSFKVK